MSLKRWQFKVEYGKPPSSRYVMSPFLSIICQLSSSLRHNLPMIFIHIATMLLSFAVTTGVWNHFIRAWMIIDLYVLVYNLRKKNRFSQRSKNSKRYNFVIKYKGYVLTSQYFTNWCTFSVFLFFQPFIVLLTIEKHSPSTLFYL